MYVCPSCGSNDWNGDHKQATCMNCGTRTDLQCMRKEKNENEELLEVIPDSDDPQPLSFPIND